jgi:hypothetical protein
MLNWRYLRGHWRIPQIKAGGGVATWPADRADLQARCARRGFILWLRDIAIAIAIAIATKICKYIIKFYRRVVRTT